MTNKQRTLRISGIAVLIVAGALVVGTVLEGHFGGKEQNTMDHGNHETPPDSDGSLVQTSSAEYQTYNALTGDDYDESFLADMIIHHQGAVEMAELALTQSSHEDIRKLSREIIEAQTEEIAEMEQWQRNWGYSTTKPHSHDSMHHGESDTMDMPAHMAMMMRALHDKTGDEFDTVWLEQMIIHHQGALNMSAPGEKNAKHPEVKKLTKRIVEAQSNEIRHMQAWQAK